MLAVYLRNFFYFSAVESSSTSLSTREKTDRLPVSAPTKSWYKNPIIIMGISMGGIFGLCLVVILVILTRKWKRKVKVNVSSPCTLGSRFVGITGSADGIVIEDLEMENLESILREDNSK